MNSDELVSVVAFRLKQMGVRIDEQADNFARAIIPPVLEHAAKVARDCPDTWTPAETATAIRAEVQHDAG